ncbi:MAG: glycosyltransferase [Rectinemataceae bacterium]
MKILHIINTLGMGGAERLLADLAPRLIARGDQVLILALSSQGDRYGSQLRLAGAEVRYCRGKHIWSPKVVLEIAGELRRWDPDVVHVHLYPSLLWASLCKSRQPRSLWMLTEHNTRRKGMGFPFLLVIERWIYRRYDRIIAISEAVRESLVARLDDAKVRITVIPNGVDLARFEHGSGRPFPANDEVFSLLMVARFSRQKDQATILRALSILSPRFRCVFLGEGETLHELASQAKALCLEDRVEFAGARIEVPDFMARANAYVQSSHWEGFGIAAVEAMAAGLPVIASAVPGLAEVVQGAGLLFPPGDAAALAGTIESLAADGALAEDLVRRGRVRAKMFSIESNAAGYLAVYDSCGTGEVA